MKKLALLLSVLLAAGPVSADPSGKGPKRSAPAQVDLDLFYDIHSNMLDNGETVRLPGADDTVDCIKNDSGGGKGRDLHTLFGCSEIDRLVETGPNARAVIRYRFGGQVMVSETRRQNKDGTVSVERLVFAVDSEAMLKKAVRETSSIGKDGKPSATKTVTELSVTDASTHGLWKAVAKQVAVMSPTISI